ncbi:MAG TPA: hypothetical protein VM165_08365 [Planctomycetaceae bacterium]|nr:hypothetical protein [Planctomycetaceae bacterium]
MAELAIGLLKLALLLLAVVLIPVSLIVSTPFILLWPRPADGTTWVQSVRSRYWRVTKAALMVVHVLDAATM